MRSWSWSVFAVVCAAQLGFAATGLFQGEAILRQGSVYRFRTAPMDPVDPFRGRYVALHFEPVEVALASGASFVAGETAYVELGVGEEGFAKLVRALPEPPPADHLALPVTRVAGSRVRVVLPFDRYYAQETRALEIDRRRANERRRLVAVVRVRGGRGVIQSLEVDPSEPEPPRVPLESDFLRPDPRLPLPPGALAALEALVTKPQLDACLSTGRCVIFPVDLHADRPHEVVFQRVDGTLLHLVGDARGRWLVAGTLQPTAGGYPPSGEAFAREVREHGAQPVPPPIADLRIGKRRFRVR